ncbi:MobC family plasmid mobilization relaxosome protein [Streptomyces sp. NPDC002012]|uniref:MobC family plasmid mobilization relaxosome protein n=1 Tax=Streptomyces sp. NPDC002012 TaxID=3154532 RepID=UPI00332D7108
MTHVPHHSDHAPDEPLPQVKSPSLMGRLRQAFGKAAPGGASSTPSPTQGRPSGISAPGVAETVQRRGTLDRGFGAEGDAEPGHHAARQAVLSPVLVSDAPHAQPTIRRFTGDKRMERVGPLRFLSDERARLQKVASEHGYKGESGFAADVVLAFVDGRFTANLPLSEDRRRLHEFRSQVLRNLNRIGVNVNQITRALNSDLTPPDLRRHLAELQHLLQVIAEALREPADPTKDLSA